VRCASTGAERRGGGLCAGPAYVVIPQAKKKEKKSGREWISAAPVRLNEWAKAGQGTLAPVRVNEWAKRLSRPIPKAPSPTKSG
jgi:hypothetical protein